MFNERETSAVWSGTRSTLGVSSGSRVFSCPENSSCGPAGHVTALLPEGEIRARGAGGHLSPRSSAFRPEAVPPATLGGFAPRQGCLFISAKLHCHQAGQQPPGNRGQALLSGAQTLGQTHQQLCLLCVQVRGHRDPPRPPKGHPCPSSECEADSGGLVEKHLPEEPQRPAWESSGTPGTPARVFRQCCPPNEGT